MASLKKKMFSFSRSIITFIIIFLFILPVFCSLEVLADSGTSIACINNPPVIIPVPDQIAYTGTPFILDINYTDIDEHSVVFADDSLLFEINEITGMINFTPTEAEIVNVTVNITDETDCANNWNTFMFELLINPESRPFYIKGRAFINGIPARNAEVSFWTPTNGKFRQVVTNEDGSFGMVEFPWDYSYTIKDEGITFGDYAEPITIKINGVETSIPKTIRVLRSDEGSIFNINFYALIEEPKHGTCLPSWTCSPWSDCFSDGKQYRDCVDTRNCPLVSDKPVEERVCEGYSAGGGFLFDFTIPPKFKILKKGEKLFSVLQLPFSSRNSSTVDIVYTIKNTKGIIIQTSETISISRGRLIEKTFEISDIYLPGEYVLEVKAVYSDYLGKKDFVFISSDSFTVIEGEVSFLDKSELIAKDILDEINTPLVVLIMFSFLLAALLIFRMPSIIVALRKRIIIQLNRIRQVRTKKFAVKKKEKVIKKVKRKKPNQISKPKK